MDDLLPMFRLVRAEVVSVMNAEFLRKRFRAVRAFAILIASINYMSAQSNSALSQCEEAWHNHFTSLPSHVKRSDCSSCEQRSDLAGECFDVRGRLNFYNGNPTFRLWIVGTNRILGLVPDEYPIAPKGLMSQLDVGVVVYGDFRVCPFADDRPGYMRYVCVESVENVWVHDPRHKGLKGQFFKGPWSRSGERPKGSSK